MINFITFNVKVCTYKNIVILLFFAASPLNFLSAESSKNNKEPEYDIHAGFEFTELYESYPRPYAHDNYTIFLGQQFRTTSIRNWGWRFLSTSTNIRERYIRKTFHTSGNVRNIRTKLDIRRLYLDYYIPGKKKKNNKILKTSVILSFGIGSHQFAYENDRHTYKLVERLGIENFIIYRNIVKNNEVNGELFAQFHNPDFIYYSRIGSRYDGWTEKKTFRTGTIGTAIRFNFLFFNTIFFEPVLDFGVNTNKHKPTWVGDFHENLHPDFSGVVMYNFGAKIEF